MPSPFPGMDPFLERQSRWKQFHASLVTDLHRQLVPKVPDGYYADAEVDLFIHEPPAEDRRFFARADDDIVITDAPGGAAVAERPATAKPAYRLARPDVLPEERHRYIEVRTIDGNRLVTAIEVLSPTNKTKERDRFIAKREDLTRAGVHFLQIDLLLGGRHLLTQDVPPHDYNAMLLRDGDPKADVWTWSLRDPLPALPVPLADDADVTLDLRAALDATYDANRYERFIYNNITPADLDPPLDDATAAWAAHLR